MKHAFSALLCMILLLLLTAIAYASPLTGDNGIGLWIVLSIVVVIVLIGVLVILKKNKGPKE